MSFQVQLFCKRTSGHSCSEVVKIKGFLYPEYIPANKIRPRIISDKSTNATLTDIEDSFVGTRTADGRQRHGVTIG